MGRLCKAWERGAKLAALVSAMALFAAAIALAAVAPGVAHADEGGAYGFSDVAEGEWYATDDILGYVVEKGLITGYADATFGPYDSITRGQLAVILHRMAGEPAVSSAPFEDVNYAEYYGAAISWARSVGVVNGMTDPDGEVRRFAPDEPVTREQLAAMLRNYAQKIGGADVASDCAAADAMPDAESVSPWARESLGWAMDKGLVSGVVGDDGVARLDPQGSAWRCAAAKMVAVLHRDVLGKRPSDEKPGGADGDGAVVYRDGVTVVSRDGWSADALGRYVIDEAVSAGDVIVLKPNESNPEGLLIRAESVSLVGGKTVVVPSAEEPSLLDAIESMNVEGTTSTIVSVEPAEGVELLGESGEIALQDIDETVDFGKLKFKIAPPNSSVSGNVSFKLSVDYGLSGSLHDKSKFEMHFVPQLTSKVDITAKKGISMDPIKVGQVKMATECPGLYIALTLYLVPEADGSLTLTYTAEGSIGYKYEKGRSVFVHELDTRCDGLEMKAEASLGVDFDCAVEFLKKPLVDAALGVGEEMEGSTTLRPTNMVCLDVKAAPYASISVGKHSALKDIGVSYEKKLDELTKPAKWHFENGSFVKECTWKEEAEGTQGGGAGQGSGGGGGSSWGEDPSEPLNPGTSGGSSTPNPASDFIYAVGDYVHEGEVYSGSIYDLEYDVVEDGGHRYQKVERDAYGLGFTLFEGGPGYGSGSDGWNYVCGHGVYITGYKGSSKDIVIPKQINGVDVVYVNIGAPLGVDPINGDDPWGSYGVVDVSRCSALKVFVADHWNAQKVELGSGSSLKQVMLYLFKTSESVDISRQSALECATFFASSQNSLVSSTLKYAKFAAMSFEGDLNLVAPNLETLICTNCGLTSLDISGYPKLKYLDVRGNNISDTTALEAWLAQPGHDGVLEYE